MQIRLALGLLVAFTSPAAVRGEVLPDAALVPYDVVVRDGLPTIPAPLTDKPGDPKEGEKVVVARRLGNCLSCHEVDALRREPFHGDVAHDRGQRQEGVRQRNGHAGILPDRRSQSGTAGIRW